MDDVPRKTRNPPPVYRVAGWIFDGTLVVLAVLVNLGMVLVAASALKDCVP